MTDNNDAFGFASATQKPIRSLADKLQQFQPRIVATPEISVEKIDKIAEERGFVSREAGEAVPTRLDAAPTRALSGRKRGGGGAFVAINTRAPLRVAEPFIEYCEKNRYSYWQGIEALMRQAGLLP